MFRAIFFVFSLFILASCTPTATLNNGFLASEAAYINGTGEAKISGQAFLRRNDGIVVYAAGSEVQLIPATAYADERMQKIYGDGKQTYLGKKFTNDDPSYYDYTRTTIADGEGRFEFSGVADGRYYVVTDVVWMAGNYRQGGALMERVQIEDGQSQEIIVRGY